MAAPRIHPLSGRGIVITRPREQAPALAKRLLECGARPIIFPAIEISPPADPAAFQAVIHRLDSFDLAIFVSPVAVDRALGAILARRSFPSHVQVAGIGAGSARALRRHGIANVIAPVHAFDSESLLACSELQNVSGKRVVIFRGDGGRELIAETLTARAATVEYAQCYRRSKPAEGVAALVAMSDAIDGFVVTSSEGLRNMHDMLGPEHRTLLTRNPLFVSHARIAAVARELAAAVVIETPPGDEGLVRGMKDYFSRSPN